MAIKPVTSPSLLEVMPSTVPIVSCAPLSCEASKSAFVSFSGWTWAVVSSVAILCQQNILSECALHDVAPSVPG